MSHILRPSAKGNPNAVSVRIEGRSMSNVNGQRRHDLRIGRQPGYVNGNKTKLNRVLITPWTGTKLRAESNLRRSLKPKARAMKSNACIATCGIVTFGNKAQKRFARLNKNTQDEAFRAIAEAMAARLKTTLTGLVVHVDETAIHAHLQFVGYRLDGDPVSDHTKKQDTSGLQDMAAEIIRRFDPKIERGHPIKERLDGGAEPHEVTHRQVNQLHRDLPLEIEELRAEIERLLAIKSKLERYIKKIEAKDILNQKEAKRLTLYEQRLQKKEAELLAQEVRVSDMVDTLAELETRAHKAAWHAERAEKRQRDAEEIERISWEAVNEAQRQEALAIERAPETLSPNHIDDLPAPLRDAIEQSAEERGFLPLRAGHHEDDVQNIRSFLEKYIMQIAALVFQQMAKTISSLRRNWRNALKREKELKTANSGLMRENERLRSENHNLREQQMRVDAKRINHMLQRRAR